MKILSIEEYRNQQAQKVVHPANAPLKNFYFVTKNYQLINVLLIPNNEKALYHKLNSLVERNLK